LLNVFSVISIVLLFGLAAKNGILLVNYANGARRDGAVRARCNPPSRHAQVPADRDDDVRDDFFANRWERL